MLAYKLPEYLEPPTIKPEEVGYCTTCGKEIYYGDIVFENIPEATVNNKAFHCYTCILKECGLWGKKPEEINKIWPHVIKALDFFDIKVVEAD